VIGFEQRAEHETAMSGWVNFRELKATVSLESVLRHYGVDWLRPSGLNQSRGRCPVHGGQGHEAFHVNLERNLFHCFACGAGGNVLDLVAAMEECSIRQAGLRLREIVAGFDPAAVAPSRAFQSRETKLVTKKREVNPRLSFSLRLDGWHPYLSGRGIKRQLADQFGIGYFRGRGLMSGRIAIPIHDRGGGLVAYGGRAVDDQLPRYRFPAGFQKALELFNYHRAAVTGSDGVIVVEGFFDCLRVHLAGFPAVVAVMGARLSEAQRELLQRRFSAITLMLDGDRTGRAATARIASQLRPRCVVTELILPTGVQPDQMSTDQIRSLLAAAERRGPTRST
jgi:DNA primase